MSAIAQESTNDTASVQESTNDTASVEAASTYDTATVEKEPPRQTDFDWKQAKKLSLDPNIVGIEDRVVRGRKGLSPVPEDFKKGTIGKVPYWVFRADELLNDFTVVLESSTGVKFAFEGFPTKDMDVGESIVILDYVNGVGPKEFWTKAGKSRRINAIRILSAPEVIQFEEGLRKKGFTLLYLNSGETVLGKFGRASTRNAVAIDVGANDHLYFRLEDFRDDSQQLLTQQAAKANGRFPVPAILASDEVKSQVIPQFDIAEIYNELDQRRFSMQIDSKKSTPGSSLVRWQKGRYKIEVIELDGGTAKVSLVITANGKPPATGFTDEDRDIMAMIGASNFDHADRIGNAAWAKEHFDTPSKMQDDKVVIETFAKESARALVIRRAQASER
jgi:hypothetical protein